MVLALTTISKEGVSNLLLRCYIFSEHDFIYYESNVNRLVGNTGLENDRDKLPCSYIA